MKQENKLSTTVHKLTAKGSLKDYFLNLFTAKVNKVSEDELIKVSMDWGRSKSEAESDIARVENLYEAVDIFLDKALLELKPSYNIQK
ncbi:MAG: hypothetical protein IJV10_03560 [Prevotella sp.]|nr:hypothetical protein [Prevotella sp.]MBQ9561341.1 hypothetical protein [Prevotella sp.]